MRPTEHPVPVLPDSATPPAVGPPKLEAPHVGDTPLSAPADESEDRSPAQPPPAIEPEATRDAKGETPSFTWTLSQRRALLAILTALLGLLVFRYAMNRSFVSDPQPDRPAGYDRLADRIDPNTADWQTLAAVPTLGEKRARAVVAEREERLRLHPGTPAFAKPEDLLTVKGIGYTVMQNLQPYLIFPTQSATIKQD